MQEMFNLSVLLIWPLICCILYFYLNELVATFISVFIGFLILPVGVYLDIPLFPNFDKNLSSLVGVLLGLIFIKKKSFNWFGDNGFVRYSILSIILLTLVNYFFNTQPLFNGEYWVVGITIHEAFVACLRNYLAISFLVVAINVVKSENDVIQLHKMIVIALLAYLPLIIIELLISPQIHNFVYGFHPHSFNQQIRNGGFRPTVFIGHGLLTANVYLGGFISLLILYKFKKFFISQPINLTLIIIFFILLILLKSATALLLAILAFITLCFLSFNLRRYTLKCIVFFSVLYPFLVSMDLIPLDSIYILFAQLFPQERLDSLFFRFFNEKLFLEYLNNYVFIGYGGMGRAMIPGAIVDGTWLVWTMRYGVIFWFIHVVLYSHYMFVKYNPNTSFQKVIIVFSVLPIIILIDQIPNSSWSAPWSWLYAGALIKLMLLYRNKSNETSYN